MRPVAVDSVNLMASIDEQVHRSLRRVSLMSQPVYQSYIVYDLQLNSMHDSQTLGMLVYNNGKRAFSGHISNIDGQLAQCGMHICDGAEVEAKGTYKMLAQEAEQMEDPNRHWSFVSIV